MQSPRSAQTVWNFVGELAIIETAMGPNGITSSVTLAHLVHWRCERKSRYPKLAKALNAAERMEKRTREKFIAYECVGCGAFHIAHDKNPETQATPKHDADGHAIKTLEAPSKSATPKKGPESQMSDLVGVVAGGIEVIARSASPKGPNKCSQWEVRCKCGKVVIRNAKSIRRAMADGRSLLCDECRARLSASLRRGGPVENRDRLPLGRIPDVAVALDHLGTHPAK
jgi:hypothetical protein